MLLSLAPMEGITGYAFRRVHAEVFGALDRYYTPFISPLPKVGTPFSKRNSRELAPANNEGFDVVPQLLTNDADRFVALPATSCRSTVLGCMLRPTGQSCSAQTHLRGCLFGHCSLGNG